MNGPSNEMMNPEQMEPTIVNGPTAPVASGPMYQITLASGAVLTNPGAFPDGETGPREVNPYIAEDGRLLV